MLRTLTAALALALAHTALAAAPTDFTFQGVLTDAGSPVAGEIDVAVTLYNDAAAGQPVGPRQQFGQVQTQAGRFQVTLDGSPAATGDALWAEVEIRSPAGVGTFVVLDERFPVGAAPFAVYALNTPQPPAEPDPTEVLSGLPFNTTFSVLTVPDSGRDAWLAGPVNLRRATYDSPTGQPIAGAMDRDVTVTIRRPFDPDDTLWFNQFDRGFLMRVTLEVTNNSTSVDWVFNDCAPVARNILVADDGGPVEELELLIDVDNMQRNISGTFATAAKAPTLGLDRGLDSRYPGGTHMSPKRRGQLEPLAILVGDLADQRPYNGGFVVGGPTSTPAFFRYSVFNPHFHWDDFVDGNQFELEVLLVDKNYTPFGQAYLPGSPAVITGWTLRLADDGLPIEELDMLYNSTFDPAGGP